MASDSIAGYTGDAENLCPRCAAQSVGWDGTGDPDDYIATAGAARGINVADQRSFDSSEWPKAFLQMQVEDIDEKCGGCHELFIG